MTKKKLTSIILWCVLSVLLLLVLIPLCSMLVQKYIQKTDVPMFMGYAWLIVLTPSMTGYANEGDLIIIKQANDYEFGDVVTYIEESGKTPVTHRIIYVDKDTGLITTKGDANMDPDRPITTDQIVGKVVGVIPYVGLFFRWLTDELGIIYIVALIAVVIAGVYFWNITKPETKKAGESADGSTDKPTDKPNNSDQPIKDEAEDHAKNDNEQSQK